jgi:hypothetical protein
MNSPQASQAVAGQRAGMTLAEARARIPARPPPDFWVGTLDGLDTCLATVTRGSCRRLASSPGGRAIQVIEYGARDTLPRAANFNSAVGARELAAYIPKGSRSRPVLLLIGPVHGQEVEALTGLCNLIHILEHGCDLRGRAQPALAALAERCRLLLVPAPNPDGVARFEPQTLCGLTGDDLRFWGQGTRPDGRFWGWPGCKARHPMRPEHVAFLGCYFDDAGVNPMHDEFFAPLGPEAPALLRLAAEEGPDVAVSLHSHEAAPTVLRPAYVPMAMQEKTRALAESVGALLAARGLPAGTLPLVTPEQALPPTPFNLTSALYHVSGALSCTFECPHGLFGPRACQVAMEAILDIQLAFYEAVLAFALAQHSGSAESAQTAP